MKRSTTLLSVLLTILFLSISARAKNTSPPLKVPLYYKQINLIIAGDQAILRTEPLNKNTKYVKCEVKGNSLKLAKRAGSPSLGYIFIYNAIRPGKSVIVEKVSKLGKGRERVETRKFVVRVFNMNMIPKVKTRKLEENINCYIGKFVKLAGISRGWGRTLKAKEIWGTMQTRSDWILEDDTGAVYVTGGSLPQKGKALTIICKVVRPSNGRWALVYYKKLTGYDPSKARPIAEGINRFAFDLYKKLALEDRVKNVLFSPFSISDALAMTYGGARSLTAKQMARVLHFSLPQREIPPAFSSLIKSIEACPQKKSYTILIANALWGQKGYHFLQSFKTLVNKYYGGGFHQLDFSSDPEGARKQINSWVEEKTAGKIKNLIAKGDINGLTRLILTNAVYFKGKWASQFKKKNTVPMPFYVSPQKTLPIPMMFQEGEFPYFEDRNLQVLELPYEGKEISMIILLPIKKDGLGELESHLSEKSLTRWRNNLHRRRVKVYLPRFKLTTKCYLAKELAKMGMPDAFSNRADFSGITGRKELKISRVIHQAYIDVNEEGTEAAAATAVTIRLTAVMKSPVFKADHPFVFMIVHKKTGTILFMGTLKEPTQ